jgi:hypothetical protein
VNKHAVAVHLRVEESVLARPTGGT